MGSQASRYLKYSLSLCSDKRGSTYVEHEAFGVFVVDVTVCPLHLTQLCQAHVALSPPLPSQ